MRLYTSATKEVAGGLLALLLAAGVEAQAQDKSTWDTEELASAQFDNKIDWRDCPSPDGSQYPTDSEYPCAASEDQFSEGLYSYWKFNGDLTDTQGNANLTGINSPGYGTGLVFSQAVDFEESSSQYARNTTADLSPGTVGADGVFTIHVWVNWESFSGFDYLFVGGSSTTAGASWFALRRDNVTSKITGWISNGSALTLATSTGAVSTGSWTSIFAWHDGDGKLRIQIDGGSEDASSGTMTGSLNTASQVYISGVLGTNLIDGLVGPVTYWANRALTASERTAYYNDAEGVPIS